jgi:hypothetical protein
MAAGRNYLLGRGENLTFPIEPPGGGGPKNHPYSFAEAKAAMLPKVADTARALDELPLIACPGDQAVAMMTMHPAYLAKSYSPIGLLAAAGLRAVGSRATTVVPRKAQTAAPDERRAATTDLFVAGPRHRFRAFEREIAGWSESSDGAMDLIKIEDFRTVRVEEVVRPIRSDSPEPLLEIALHGAGIPIDMVLGGFRDFLDAMDVQIDLDRRLTAGTLLFLPVRVPQGLIPELARFSFVRMVREMPALRLSYPLDRLESSGLRSIPCRLPFEGPLAPDVKVAVFDGGLPETPDLTRWTRRIDAEGVGPASPDFLEHGLAVTSALLFGPLSESNESQVPYARVDHYRVLDEEAKRDLQTALYPVLQRIVDVLKSMHYDYVSLCLGPEEPIDDDVVDPWTILLDQRFARGDVLATIAAGNTGESDPDAGLNRIQPPADCVNGLTVGACDSASTPWARATYSSVGPGRSPGRIKPDVLAFGGTEADPYMVLGPGRSPRAVPKFGSSVAGPTVLRTGLGIRAHLGVVMRPMTIKALLTHRSEPNYEGHVVAEHGWGRVRTDIEEMLTCADDTVHVVYQGTLRPREYVRAKIPVPAIEIPGKVHLAVTICTASLTDPEHLPSYTRSGIDVVFRPHMKRFPKKKEGRPGKSAAPKQPASRPFFRTKPYMNETELRDDAYKWETTLSAFDSLLGKSLHDPVLELHHNARIAGADCLATDPIPYAMIITVRAPDVKDYYNRVFVRYKGQLEPLVPIIDIAISI